MAIVGRAAIGEATAKCEKVAALAFFEAVDIGLTFSANSMPCFTDTYQPRAAYFSLKYVAIPIRLSARQVGRRVRTERVATATAHRCNHHYSHYCHSHNHHHLHHLCLSLYSLLLLVFCSPANSTYPSIYIYTTRITAWLIMNQTQFYCIGFTVGDLDHVLINHVPMAGLTSREVKSLL